jgi:hypothetical protein
VTSGRQQGGEQQGGVDRRGLVAPGLRRRIVSRGRHRLALRRGPAADSDRPVARLERHPVRAPLARAPPAQVLLAQEPPGQVPLVLAVRRHVGRGRYDAPARAAASTRPCFRSRSRCH